MTQDTVALALTAFFVFGCITIYEARQHARAMTPILGIVAVCLGLFVALAASAQKASDDTRTSPRAAYHARR